MRKVQIGCVARDNVGNGFLVASNCKVINCISTGCTGTSGIGFETGVSTTNITWVNCVAHGNAKSGWSIQTGTGLQTWHNCIAYGNLEYGWSQSGSSSQFTANASMLNCAGGFNTSGNRIATPGLLDLSFVNLTADPFNNASSGNFTLNNTAGGGAALRAAGFPGTLLGLLNSTGYTDIGAFQHQDSAGGPIIIKRRKKVI